jgi:hypothetical protein
LNGELGFGEYVAGLAWLGFTLACTGTAAFLVVQRRLSHLPVPTAVLAGGVTFYGLVVAVHVVPLALGLLSRPAVLVCGLAVLGLALAVPGRAAERERPARPPESRVSVVIAAIASLAIAAWLVGAASGRLPNPIITTDVATFDLPIAARWIQTGSMWDVIEFVPLTSHGAYPHHGVVSMLAAVLPWESDFAARIVPYLTLPFAGLATFALGRELGAPASTATTMAVAGVALPIVGISTVDLAMPDGLIYACIVAGVLFLVRHARTARTADLCMAGVALGLALGTKWYGLSAVAVVLAVWAGGSLLARRAPRQVAAQAGVLAALIAACGGIWLVRNWISYGNPLFPLDISPLGLELFDAPRDPFRERAGASLAERLSEAEVSSELLDALRRGLGFLGALLLAAAVAAVPWAWARARDARATNAPVVAAVAVVAIGIVGAYAVTPYTAGPEGSTTLAFVNTRYAIPGLMLAAAAMAALAGWAGRGRVVLEALALLATLVAITDSAPVDNGRFAAAAVALLALALVARRFAQPAAARLSGPRGRLIAAAAVLVLLAAAAAAGDRLQRKFAEQRLTQDDLLAYVLSEVEPGAKIGLGGIWSDDGPPPVLAAFGPRLENDVSYVGREDRGQLKELEDAGQFREALAEGGYDYVIVGRSPLPSNHADGWVEQLDLEPLAENDRFWLYRVPF